MRSRYGCAVGPRPAVSRMEKHEASVLKSLVLLYSLKYIFKAFYQAASLNFSANDYLLTEVSKKDSQREAFKNKWKVFTELIGMRSLSLLWLSPERNNLEAKPGSSPFHGSRK